MWEHGIRFEVVLVLAVDSILTGWYFTNRITLTSSVEWTGGIVV